MVTVPIETPVSGPPFLAGSTPPPADAGFLQVLGAALAGPADSAAPPEAPPEPDPPEVGSTVASRAAHPEMDGRPGSTPPAGALPLPDRPSGAGRLGAPAGASSPCDEGAAAPPEPEDGADEATDHIPAPATAIAALAVLPPTPVGGPAPGPSTGGRARSVDVVTAEPAARAGRSAIAPAAPGGAEARPDAPVADAAAEASAPGPEAPGAIRGSADGGDPPAVPAQAETAERPQQAAARGTPPAPSAPTQPAAPTPIRDGQPADSGLALLDLAVPAEELVVDPARGATAPPPMGSGRPVDGGAHATAASPVGRRLAPGDAPPAGLAAPALAAELSPGQAAPADPAAGELAAGFGRQAVPGTLRAASIGIPAEAAPEVASAAWDGDSPGGITRGVAADPRRGVEIASLAREGAALDARRAEAAPDDSLAAGRSAEATPIAVVTGAEAPVRPASEARRRDFTLLRGTMPPPGLLRPGSLGAGHAPGAEGIGGFAAGRRPEAADRPEALDAVGPAPERPPFVTAAFAGAAPGGGETAPAAAETVRGAPTLDGPAQQIVTAARLHLRGDGGTVEMHLEPPELGQVRLQVALQDGALVARISTDTTAAQRMLEGQANALRAALQDSGLPLQSLEIGLGLGLGHSGGHNPQAEHEAAPWWPEGAQREAPPSPPAPHPTSALPRPAGLDYLA